MKGLIILLLAFAYGADVDEKCLVNEFKIDGYHTGQNIDLDLDGTMIKTAKNENDIDTTYLAVQFLVPQVYVKQYNNAAYAITFNRAKTLTENDVLDEDGNKDFHKTSTEVFTDRGDGHVDDPACYTNRWTDPEDRHNKTSSMCPQGENTDIWKTNGADEEQPCLEKMEATVSWENVMTNKWFGEKEVKSNGRYTEIFLLATVETWTRFTQTVEDGDKYKGQMTGNLEYANDAGDDGMINREGKYTGDGGNTDESNRPREDGYWDFPALHMDDERYTLYQIPFILRFPKSVVVRQDFTLSDKVTLLTGIVRQEQITVNLNPDIKDTTDDDDDSNSFAKIDVTVRTNVAFPYAIRGPNDESHAKMTVITGPDRDDEDIVNNGDDPSDDEIEQNPAKYIKIIDFQEKETCRGKKEGGSCAQNIKMRITPRDDRPCSVEGYYTMEFWADCIGGHDADDDGKGDKCALDVLNINSDLAIRRDKNGYFKHTFHIDHTDFCPKVLDTVKVRADIHAYHSEKFATKIGDTEDVHTNDVLFYEVSYRTQSDMAPDPNTFENNDETDPFGTSDIIDYVRATKIYATVTLGVDVENNNAFSDTWKSGTDWRENVNFSLGGNRMPDDDTDFTKDPSVEIQNDPENEDKIVYTVRLCEVERMDSWVIQQTRKKARDCFDLPNEANTVFDDKDKENTSMGDDKFAMDTSETDKDSRGKIAVQYFDFYKVEESLGGPDKNNQIEENEIAFRLRLDERIIPVGPLIDDSHIRITVEAEIYYRGNRHPTNRRRLQGPAGGEAGNLRKQAMIKSHSLPVTYRSNMKECTVRQDAQNARIDLVLTYGNQENMPRIDDVNDWSNVLAFEIERLARCPKSLSVWNVKNNKQNLFSTLNSNVRRLEKLSDNEISVQLNIASNGVNTAGEIATVLQSYFLESSAKITTLKKSGAKITGMTVPTCYEKPEVEAKLASSAIVSSTLIAFLIGFVSLL